MGDANCSHSGLRMIGNGKRIYIYIYVINYLNKKKHIYLVTCLLNCLYEIKFYTNISKTFPKYITHCAHSCFSAWRYVYAVGALRERRWEQKSSERAGERQLRSLPQFCCCSWPGHTTFPGVLHLAANLGLRSVSSETFGAAVDSTGNLAKRCEKKNTNKEKEEGENLKNSDSKTLISN